MSPRPVYPRIIAHRCGGALAPENTLPGLDIAARLGCRGVEFDVMLSADGVPLLIHDETLDRTTTGHGHVAELSAAQIRAYDAGAPHHKAFAVSPPPTFDEALARCAALDLWANIEIKPATGHEAETGRSVAERLSAGWNGDGMLSSFSLDALRAVRSVSANLPLAILYVVLPDDWLEHAAELGASAIHLAADRMTPENVRQLSGWTWACYTVNRREQAVDLFAQGCAAVFTDRPDLWTQSEM
jgi:glycerophosphoryl diester phosphodiesterase